METVRESTVNASHDYVTLDQVRAWPPAVDVAEAAKALGVSKGHIYTSIKRGEFPIRVIQMGTRTKIITASLLEVLEGK